MQLPKINDSLMANRPIEAMKNYNNEKQKPENVNNNKEPNSLPTWKDYGLGAKIDTKA